MWSIGGEIDWGRMHATKKNFGSSYLLINKFLPKEGDVLAEIPSLEISM